jgi:hypothetical protein
LLLAEDVGNVIGAEGASGIRFGEGTGHRVRAILADQFQQFVELARQHPVAIGHATQIALGHVGGAETVHKIEEALLRLRAAGRRPLFRQFPLETLGAEGLAAPPTARVRDDLLVAMVDGNGTGIGFHRELAAYKAMWDAVSIAIELQAEILVDQSLRRVTVVVRDHWQWA